MTLYMGGPMHLKEVRHLTNLEPNYTLSKIENLDGMFALHSSVKNLRQDLVYSFAINSDHMAHLTPETAARYSKWFTKAVGSFTNDNNWVFVNPDRFLKEAEQHITYRAFYRALSRHLFQDREVTLRTTLSMFHTFFPKAFMDLKYGTRAERIASFRNIRPLAKNTYRELRALLNPKDGPEEEILVLSLSYYCRSTGYLKAIARARTRITLKGEFTEVPTNMEIDHALRVLKHREVHLPNVNNKINKES